MEFDGLMLGIERKRKFFYGKGTIECAGVTKVNIFVAVEAV